MDLEQSKYLEAVLDKYTAMGYIQRNQWQAYNLSVSTRTMGWITTIHKPITGEQCSIWISASCDQYTIFDWSKAENLDL